MLFSDWDGSGRSDLRISNDRNYYDPANGEEQLWRIASGEPPRLYTAADGWVQVTGKVADGGRNAGATSQSESGRRGMRGPVCRG